MRLNKKSGTNIRAAAIAIIFTATLLMGTKRAEAQLINFHSVYFQNEYLANPAMAGIYKGLNLDLAYQKQWTTVPGSPKLQNATADYNAGNRVGLGLNFSNDQAGLISRTRVMGTYAYHLPVDSRGDRLNFGFSLGLNDSYIDNTRIVGDADDIEAQTFNQRRAYIDGDLGIAYTSNHLTLQGALPNLRSIFFKQEDGDNLDVDRSTFFTALSYKIFFSNTDNNFNVEPKIAYRGIKGFDNIFDAGFNLEMTEYNFSFSGIYHSNQSATLGAGLDLHTIALLLAYTNNTGPLRTYADNTFELGIKFRLLR